MGKLELEAKAKTVGIFEARGWHLEEENWQTEGVLWVASFSVILSGVLAAA
jgi:hypothetical protein